MTKEQFLAEVVRLATQEDAAGMRSLAERHLEDLLPLCTDEESWRLDTLMKGTYMLADAREAAAARKTREHAA